jgi:hypothetical protein
MRHIIDLFTVMSCLTILVACKLATPNPTATPSALVIISPSPIVKPSSTIARTPSRTISPPTATPTLTPTNKMTPSATNEPYLSPTLPVATLSILQTLDAYVTQNPDVGKYYETVMRECLTLACNSYRLGMSPNGIWAAFFTVNENIQNDGGLIITNIKGKKRWYIYNSDLTADIDLGTGVVRVEHWSLDGKYVYLSPYFAIDGGYSWFWNDTLKLIRFDLETGSYIDTRMNRSFSFSPNDRYIAYRGDDGVRIFELKTGIEQVFPMPTDTFDFGRFTWSPDGKRLIFVTSLENIENTQEQGFSSFLIDLRDNTIRTVFKNDMRYIYPVSWIDPNIVILKGLFDGQQYILDLGTNEIKPAARP